MQGHMGMYLVGCANLNQGAIFNISVNFYEVLSLLTILLSWLPVTLVILIIIICNFKEPMKDWVMNFSLRTPGDMNSFSQGLI